MFAHVFKEEKVSKRDSCSFVDAKGNETSAELHDQMVAGVDENVVMQQARDLAKGRIPDDVMEWMYPITK